MIDKNITHTQQESSRKHNYSLVAILIIGLITLLGTLYLINGGYQNTDPVQASTDEVVVTDDDALTQQDTQPRIEQASERSIVEYNETLATEYAQPWLENVEQSDRPVWIRQCVADGKC